MTWQTCISYRRGWLMRTKWDNPYKNGSYNSIYILGIIISCKPVVLNYFGTRDPFHGRQFFHGRGGGEMDQAVMWAMGSDGERWGAIECDGERWRAMVSGRRSFAGWPLTSSYAAWFLTGQGPLSVCGLGLGDPCIRKLRNLRLRKIR